VNERKEHGMVLLYFKEVGLYQNSQKQRGGGEGIYIEEKTYNYPKHIRVEGRVKYLANQKKAGNS